MTATESQLQTIWADLLKIDGTIGTDDDFLLIGGTSLLLTMMGAVISERLHVDVSLRDLFKYPTIRLLAKHIDKLATPSRPKTDDSQRL